MPYMQFLFVRPELCLQLLSDSTSRWTPLLSANGWHYQPPYRTFTDKRMLILGTHQKELMVCLPQFLEYCIIFLIIIFYRQVLFKPVPSQESRNIKLVTLVCIVIIVCCRLLFFVYRLIRHISFLRPFITSIK